MQNPPMWEDSDIIVFQQSQQVLFQQDSPQDQFDETLTKGRIR